MPGPLRCLWLMRGRVRAMRKVRDYDAELKALGDKARALKAKRVEQLGQLVEIGRAHV